MGRWYRVQQGPAGFTLYYRPSSRRTSARSIVPASTVAMTAILFLDVNANDETGFRGGVDLANDASAQRNSLRETGGFASGASAVVAAAALCCANDMRGRGTGGGSSRSTSKSAVRYINECIDVARLLRTGPYGGSGGL